MKLCAATACPSKFCLLVLALTVGLALFATAVQPAAAQEEPAAEKKEGDDGHGGGGHGGGARNLFTHIIVSAGWFFGPLMFGLSITLITIAVLLALDLRLANAIPPSFVEEFTEMVNKRQFKQAFELCREDTSFLARVLASGMARLQYGIEDARDAAINQTESIRAGKETTIAYLSTIGTLGPLLGLMGTVYGMILAFMRIGEHGSPNPQLLAGDISHALVATLLGISLAAPGIFFHTLFKNRLTRLSNDTGNLADDLLTQIYHNTRKTTGGAGAQADTRTTAAT